eukprot:CAMPEP_0171455434 /NCGR_PEP_ID=MMETSP0945-20130129/2332_1 /TAXON_ID=109269 /ORGANISM="Vaucheria litorea, Strain CCMP2940" /LENGTH=74 /DNA_ID=CAMNT_0011980677 /DNA_START=1359 /DNA_END=1580 /DNA_ORIENTATION=-
MKEIGRGKGKTCGQVALNWAICKGTVPIVGAKNVQQAKENLGAVGWRLDASEIEEIERIAFRAKIQGQQNIFQN